MTNGYKHVIVKLLWYFMFLWTDRGCGRDVEWTQGDTQLKKEEELF